MRDGIQWTAHASKNNPRTECAYDSELVRAHLNSARKTRTWRKCWAASWQFSSPQGVNNPRLPERLVVPRIGGLRLSTKN